MSMPLPPMSKALTDDQWKPLRDRVLTLTLDKMGRCVITNPATKTRGVGHSPAQAYADYEDKAAVG